MNYIYNNPFRILGLPITASEREIAKQINTLATYAEMGKVKSFETDFPFLPSVERTPQAIEEAKKQIEQSESKLLYSLFWFWKNNTTDELAFEVLKDGNSEKAISIWEKSVLSNKHKVFKPIVLNENLIASSTHFDFTDDESHLLKKNGDEYIVDRKKEDSYSIPCAFYDFDFDSNWAIECDTSWLAGIDNESYGIVFGREKGSYYFFGIAGSDSFMYAKYDDWSFIPLIKWKDTPKFNKWGSNNLKIEKVNTTLKFFVNGVNVDSWQAEPFFGMNFGFKVTNNQKISFRNFRFSRLVEDGTYGEGINVTQKNFSNIKNLSTLYLGLAVASTKGTFKHNHFSKGIALAKNIFANGQMEVYSKLIAGDRYNYNSEKALHFYINDILDTVKPFLDKTDGISTNEFLNSFASFPIEARQFLNNKFVAKQIQNIDKEIELAQSTRKASAANATDAGKTLMKNTMSDLAYLRNILSVEDYQYQTIADKLSLAIVQCGIDSFNFCKTPDGEIDYTNAIKSEEGYIHEYEYALSIAITQRAKDRAKDNLESCRNYIENKLYYSCWFCGDEPEQQSKYEVTLYKITSRDWQGVKYQYIPIVIPRCPKCKKFHQLDYHFESSADSADLIGAILEFVFLYIGGNLLSFVAKSVVKIFDSSKRKTKDTSRSTISEFPKIHKMLNENWQFEKPKA